MLYMSRTWCSLYWGGIFPAFLGEKKILNNNSLVIKKHIYLSGQLVNTAYSHVSAVASLFFRWVFILAKGWTRAANETSPCALKNSKLSERVTVVLIKVKKKKNSPHSALCVLHTPKVSAKGVGGIRRAPGAYFTEGQRRPASQTRRTAACGTVRGFLSCRETPPICL